MSLLNCLTVMGIILSTVAITQGIAILGTQTLKWQPQILNYLAIFTIGIQWVSFLHASGLVFRNAPTEKYYDLIGSLTYLSTLGISIFQLLPNRISARQIISTSFAAVWAIRLGSFLFYRIHKSGGVDSRFTEIKKNPGRFLVAWTLQGVWVFLTLLGVLVVNQEVDEKPLWVVNYVGMGLFVVGFVTEVTADLQKLRFKENPANNGKWIDEGLWSISRHPNYFGEIVLWIGVSLTCFDVVAVRRLLCFGISPVFVTCLLMFVSGVPLLEKKADEKWGESELYQKYKRSTPVLVPFWRKCW